MIIINLCHYFIYFQLIPNHINNHFQIMLFSSFIKVIHLNKNNLVFLQMQ